MAKGTMLIGYDVEWHGEEPVTERFLEQARSLHNRLGVPATLFILGQTLERCVAHFQSIAEDPLFDLQQHTYSHQLLKTLYYRRWPIGSGSTWRRSRRNA